MGDISWSDDVNARTFNTFWQWGMGVGSLHLSTCLLAMSLDTGVLFVHWIVVVLHRLLLLVFLCLCVWIVPVNCGWFCVSCDLFIEGSSTLPYRSSTVTCSFVCLFACLFLCLFVSLLSDWFVG
jgi:hypothetical protein